MFPQQFTSFEFLQKKRGILLYHAKDDSHHYILKSIITKEEADRQAFYDEYESLRVLESPFLPKYYGIREDFSYPDREGAFLTLCMEDCSTEKPFCADHYSLTELLRILHQAGDILFYLLKQGILYTDLNPSNLMVKGQEESIEVKLIDFTYCYYFLRNPRPLYPLRFSYDLSPHLKGHQLLIQEMALLLQEFLGQRDDLHLPSSVYFLLETGLHPSESLLLPDYLALIKKSFI